MRSYARERRLHFPALDDAARRAEVSAVATRLMEAVGRLIPVLPVSLVASILAREPARALSELDLKAAVHARMHELEAGGAHLYIPRQDQDYAFGVGLRMLTLRHIVRAEDGLFRPAPEHLDVLAYYANAIAHLAGNNHKAADRAG
jgi:glycerol-3-phosphate O-acyltransferase